MIIAVIGKGGVGKTTITALLLRRLMESGETPLLAIDADPSNCLGSALGISVERTLADLREDLRDSPNRPRSMSSAEWLALQAEEAILEDTGFDLLTMGRPEGKGCYCFVNNLIRDHLDRLSRSYRHVLLDCEAGLEHLSRRTTGRPDILVCVTNRSKMAAETVRRSLNLFEQLHGELPPVVDLVLNQFDAGEPLAAEMSGIAGGGRSPFRFTWTIPSDPKLAAC
jgi:CO dehydrogenase maturation factor